jgi:hypothetical protein
MEFPPTVGSDATLKSRALESRLSRYGMEPLLLIADELKANLIAEGWFQLPHDLPQFGP